jgi:hypothetical protein
MFDIVIGSINTLNVDIWPGDRLLLAANSESIPPASLLTSAPFALKASQLGGYFASDFLKRNMAESTKDSTGSPVLRVENAGTGRGMTVVSAGSHGVYGKSSSTTLAAIEGEGAGSGPGLRGSATANHGAIGYSSASDKAGVFGNSPSGIGVWGNSDTNVGVYGYSATDHGVEGKTIASDESTPAIYGRSEGLGDGVYGWSQNRHGVYGVTSSGQTDDAGVYGRNNGAGPAMYSDGKLYVASGGVFIAGGDLHAEGAFKGDVGLGGAPFPRPAFESDWIEVEPPASFTLGVSGALPTTQYDNDNFVIDLMTKFNGFASNYDVGRYVFYTIESDNDVIVIVSGDAPSSITHVRVRIWYYR